MIRDLFAAIGLVVTFGTLLFAGWYAACAWQERR